MSIEPIAPDAGFKYPAAREYVATAIYEPGAAVLVRTYLFVTAIVLASMMLRLPFCCICIAGTHTLLLALVSYFYMCLYTTLSVNIRKFFVEKLY